MTSGTAMTLALIPGPRYLKRPRRMFNRWLPQSAVDAELRGAEAGLAHLKGIRPALPAPGLERVRDGALQRRGTAALPAREERLAERAGGEEAAVRVDGPIRTDNGVPFASAQNAPSAKILSCDARPLTISSQRGS